MAGINEQVQEFLDSWPVIRRRLEETLKEMGKDEGLFHGDRACRSLQSQSKDDIQAVMGESNPGL